MFTQTSSQAAHKIKEFINKENDPNFANFKNQNPDEKHTNEKDGFVMVPRMSDKTLSIGKIRNYTDTNF